MYHLVEVTKYSHTPNHYLVLASFESAEDVLDAQAHKRKEKEIFKKKSYNKTDYIVMSEVEVKTQEAA